ncbi:MAG: alpha/beta hydrolase [Oscillospiraceae bacterium]|nr:alpha/beta hydrolase [Oscillospiraceae bacterium]
MLTRKLRLPYADPAVRLTALLPDGLRKPAVVVLPGGGYESCAPDEGLPIAKRFCDAGYAAFLLEYSTLATSPAATVFPGLLREVALTVAHIRRRAWEFDVDASHLVIFGASAGAHLAASYGNRWMEPGIGAGIAAADKLCPEALILLYPALEPDALPQSRMMEAIYGHKAPYSTAERVNASTPLNVSAQTPPTILFHSAPDPSVPMDQALHQFLALQRHGVPSEVHVFGSGEHAYGLGLGTPASIWPELSFRFLRELRRHPERFDPEYAQAQREARHSGG